MLLPVTLWIFCSCNIAADNSSQIVATTTTNDFFLPAEENENCMVSRQEVVSNTNGSIFSCGASSDPRNHSQCTQIHNVSCVLSVYFCWIWAWSFFMAASSCWEIDVSFLPMRSWISRYLATHRSKQTASPLVSSASRYFGGMHFFWHAVVILKHKNIVHCQNMELHHLWQDLQIMYTSPQKPENVYLKVKRFWMKDKQKIKMPTCYVNSTNINV